MPRVCNREGCGRRIVAKDGSPDYRKHFCGSACLKTDKRERVQAKRSRLEYRRCSHCGRNPILAPPLAVLREASQVRQTLTNDCVKLHRRRADDSQVPDELNAKSGG
jgi:hypothetical protein